ncbi:hypothetical protein FGO68_gene3539 [Halteria grandinella]|uniref:Glycosylasparaginase n=1 Tax=Halteria grandinella TaxID=5974 RepID=A0A8J8SZZ1_HALGN|nr:hypothetical protein FGO68_gene3539 [Halteria grandinella]
MKNLQKEKAKKQITKKKPLAKVLIKKKKSKIQTKAKDFIIVSTWDHGLRANEVASKTLLANGCALDAIIEGCKITELENGQRTVGLEGWPDRDGKVTLDAAIMVDDGRAGSVAFVQRVQHPIELAKLVMEKTPHVMLVGAGAEQFAREQGIKLMDCKLDQVQQDKLDDWRKERLYAPEVNIENHDTISMIAMDKQGQMVAGSTTSGLAFKMHGRVGDSPVIGSGIYVDKDVGAAVCTGLGEAVLRTVGAHSVIESMRHGKSPQLACEAVIKRIMQKIPGSENYQVGVIALDYKGRVGACGVQQGFTYALANSKHNIMKSAKAIIQKSASIELAMQVKNHLK